ncbi:MAG: hypothetical protein ACYTEQ_29860 [Planctomycetota bacterium]|jgi:hypothetical protein
MLSKVELVIDGKIEVTKTIDLEMGGATREISVGALKMATLNMIGMILSGYANEAVVSMTEFAKVAIEEIQRRQQEEIEP